MLKFRLDFNQCSELVSLAIKNSNSTGIYIYISEDKSFFFKKCFTFDNNYKSCFRLLICLTHRFYYLFLKTFCHKLAFSSQNVFSCPFKSYKRSRENLLDTLDSIRNAINLKLQELATNYIGFNTLQLPRSLILQKIHRHIHKTMYSIFLYFQSFKSLVVLAKDFLCKLMTHPYY